MPDDAPAVVEPTTRFHPPAAPRDAGRSAFLPSTLLALAFVAWLVFQTTQLVVDRQQIALVQSSLDPQAESATKLRNSLDALATSTAKLASDGNANARVIVDELRKRGITINPAATAKPP